MAVPSTVKVQKGGYSVAKDIKNTGETVKVQKGGYSVARDKGTTVQSGYVPLSTSSGPKSSDKKISSYEQNLKDQGYIYQNGAYYNPSIEAEANRQNAINEAIRKQKQAETAAKLLEQQQVVYPSIKVGSDIKSTLQTQPIAKSATQPTVTKITYTPVTTKIPTPVSPSYAQQYAKNVQQVQTQVKESAINAKSRAGVASAAINPPVVSAKSLQGTYYNVPKGSVPSVVSHSYTPEYVKQREYKHQPNKFNLLVPDNNKIMQDLVSPSGTMSFLQNQRKQALESIRLREKQEAEQAMNLGRLEKYASTYEGYVKTLSEKYSKKVGKVTNPAMAAFVAGGSGALLATPTATARMGVGIVKNPVATVRETFQGTVEGLATSPWRTLGELTGAGIGGKIAGTAGGKGIYEVSKNAPKIQPASLSEIRKGGASAIYDQVKYDKQLVIMQKPVITKLTPIKQISPFKSLKEYIKTNYKKGAAAAPTEVLKSKSVLAFGKTETANFFETLKRNPKDYEFFKSSYDITKQIQKSKTPVFKPDKFKVTAKDVPDKAKAYVEDAIRTYQGNIEIRGSISQQMQLGKYMKRQPADVEIFVDNPAKFAEHLDTRLKRSGTQYTIDGRSGKSPKVKFGEAKGIEIFEIKESTPLNAIEGYLPDAPLPYTYKTFGSIRTDNVNIMNLREQAGRKAAGANLLYDNKIQPQHSGRLKDVGDFTDIAVGYALEKNIKVSNLVAKFNEEAKARYGQMTWKDKEGNVLDIPESTYYRKLYTELDTNFKPIGGFGFEPITKVLYSKSAKAPVFTNPIDLQRNIALGIKPVNSININTDNIKKMKIKPFNSMVERTVDIKVPKMIKSFKSVKPSNHKMSTGFGKAIDYPVFTAFKPKSINYVNIGSYLKSSYNINNIKSFDLKYPSTRTDKPFKSIVTSKKPVNDIINKPPETSIPYIGKIIPPTKTTSTISRPPVKPEINPFDSVYPTKPIRPQKGYSKRTYPPEIPKIEYPIYRPVNYPTTYPTNYPTSYPPEYPTERTPPTTPPTETPPRTPIIATRKITDKSIWTPNVKPIKNPLLKKKKAYPIYIGYYGIKPSQWFIKNPVQRYMRPTVPWVEAKKSNLRKYNESYFGKWYDLKNLRGAGK